MSLVAGGVHGGVCGHRPHGAPGGVFNQAPTAIPSVPNIKAFSTLRMFYLRSSFNTTISRMEGPARVLVLSGSMISK
jgi:hypothetical protein